MEIDSEMYKKFASFIYHKQKEYDLTVNPY